MNINNIELIRPPKETTAKVKHYIQEHKLSQFKKEIYYHFNLEDWQVNLADTKRSMINYDFADLVNNFQANTIRRKDENNREYKERQKNETEALRINFLQLYQNFRSYVLEKMKPIAKEMGYIELFQLFKDTWGNAPFKLHYLLEDMFLFFGNKSIMQNVVGPSGSGKSTRTMIEFNSLPAVLRVDDATVAGISRDCQTKGIYYLDNTVVYYNDVGDSTQMQNNFRDCLQTVYKKLFSEGAVNRTIAMKNSDRTLRLDLHTPNGFKLKFNSVKPIFNEDDGQTAARTMTISLPSQNAREAERMLLTGRFGENIWTKKDPRIFKDIFQAYYETRDFEGFDNEYRAELGHRYNTDHDDEVNWHGISNMIYVHQEMYKLYGREFYKERYYNRVMINTSIEDLESQLYDVIKDGLGIKPAPLDSIRSENHLNEFTIAKTKSATNHKNKYDYNAFTIKAVKGIRRNFIEKNVTKISSLLKTMEEHNLCAKVGTLERRYNIYVLLEKEDQVDDKQGTSN